MDDEVKYITGEYRLRYDVRYAYGRIGAMMAVFKGGEHVGTLLYHPVAKQIVYSAYTASTIHTLNFVSPLLDMGTFIAVFKMLKRKSRKEIE